MYQPCRVWKALFLWCLPSLLQTLAPTNFPEPWGKGLMEKFCLGPSVHRSRVLFFSCGSLYLFLLLQEEASLMMTEQTDL